jgi:glutamine amidotransferase
VPAARALAETVVEVSAAAPGSRLNLLLTDGQQIVASTAGHALSVRTGPASVLVSSEPLDPGPAWQAVPDGSLLVATPSGLDITVLGRS